MVKDRRFSERGEVTVLAAPKQKLTGNLKGTVLRLKVPKEVGSIMRQFLLALVLIGK